MTLYTPDGVFQTSEEYEEYLRQRYPEIYGQTNQSQVSSALDLDGALHCAASNARLSKEIEQQSEQQLPYTPISHFQNFYNTVTRMSQLDSPEVHKAFVKAEALQYLNEHLSPQAKALVHGIKDNEVQVVNRIKSPIEALKAEESLRQKSALFNLAYRLSKWEEGTEKEIHRRIPVPVVNDVIAGFVGLATRPVEGFLAGLGGWEAKLKGEKLTDTEEKLIGAYGNLGYQAEMENLAGEGIAKAIGKATDAVSIAIPESVKVKLAEGINAVKSKVVEVVPKRQTVLKGARIYEYETEMPLHLDILARIDRGITKQLDIINTEAISGLRQVELITGKRWKIGKSQPLENAGKAKTLAEVTEYVNEKGPEGIKIIKRKGLGKAILDYEGAESTVIREISEGGAIDVHTFEKLPTSLNEFSSLLQRISEIGKVPNVDAELLATPSEYSKVLDKLIDEFKHEGVGRINLRTLIKAEEIAKKGEEKAVFRENNVRYFRVKNGDVVSVIEPMRRLRVTEVRFLPDLTREIVRESKKIEKVVGKVVKPEDLIERERVIKESPIDKILGWDKIKEVVEPSEKDLAIQRLMSKENRRELAKTLRDIYGGEEAKASAKAVEVLDEVLEDVSKAEEKAMMDYPVLKEENIFDIVREKLDDVSGMLKPVAENLAKKGLSVGLGYLKESGEISTLQPKINIDLNLVDEISGIKPDIGLNNDIDLNIRLKTGLDTAVKTFENVLTKIDVGIDTTAIPKIDIGTVSIPRVDVIPRVDIPELTIPDVPTITTPKPKPNTTPPPTPPSNVPPFTIPDINIPELGIPMDLGGFDLVGSSGSASEKKAVKSPIKDIWDVLF